MVITDLLQIKIASKMLLLLSINTKIISSLKKKNKLDFFSAE